MRSFMCRVSTHVENLLQHYCWHTEKIAAIDEDGDTFFGRSVMFFDGFEYEFSQTYVHVAHTSDEHFLIVSRMPTCNEFEHRYICPSVRRIWAPQHAWWWLGASSMQMKSTSMFVTNLVTYFQRVQLSQARYLNLSRLVWTGLYLWRNRDDLHEVLWQGTGFAANQFGYGNSFKNQWALHRKHCDENYQVLYIVPCFWNPPFLCRKP